MYETPAESALPSAAMRVATSAAYQWGLVAKRKKRKGLIEIGKSSRHVAWWDRLGVRIGVILGENSLLGYSVANSMRILGIETSCDETAVALIEAEGLARSATSEGD